MKKLNLLLVAIATAVAVNLHADPMGTAFTYQGKLQDGGVPANGYYDFEFRLFGGQNSIPQFGSTISQTDILVTNGLFTVKLDFGNYFPGDARWLEIWANTNTVAVVELEPRQELTPTPYAIYAGTAGNVTNQAITTLQLAPDAVTGPAIANGNVVRSLNGLTDVLTLAAGANISLFPVGNTITITGTGGGGPAWLLGGNGGTTSTINFLGTTDFEALELRVNSMRALRIEPDFSSPNLIGGAPANGVTPGYFGGTIGGGGDTFNPNRIGHDFCTVGGGRGNTNESWYGTIGGGLYNRTFFTNIAATVAGGQGNFAAANWASIGGGNGNVASGQDGTVAGGSGNRASAGQSTVGGGIGNQVLASEATISGGSLNRIEPTATRATIAGGYSNTNEAQRSTISGGANNWTKADDSFIGGGQRNLTIGGSSVIGGGLDNLAYGARSVVGGGQYNAADGSTSTIGGGVQNLASADYSTVGGGRQNQGGALEAVVAGGAENLATGQQSTVAGGTQNTNQTQYGTIGGGALNLVNATYSGTIAGGYANTVLGQDATIGGGSYNTISNAALLAVVGGGQDNLIGTWVTGSGEFTTTNHGVGATISGGVGNQAFGEFSTIGGGQNNWVSAPHGTVAGGQNNAVLGDFAAIGGGANNTASGSSSVVAGGINNQALGNYALAAGRRARALHPGSFVWGDSTDADIVSTNINSMTFRAAGGVRFFSNAGATAGAFLAPNGTSWASISDRNAKKNFQPVDVEAVLEKLARLPVQQWNYRWEADNEVPHLGPMAQDFKAAFYPGRDDKSITTQEIDGVTLAAIQGLNQKLAQKEAEFNELKRDMAQLKVLLERTLNK